MGRAGLNAGKSGAVVGGITLFGLFYLAVVVLDVKPAVFAAAALAAGLFGWSFGWGFGTRRGRKAEKHAREQRAAAIEEQARAVEIQRLAASTMEKARDLQAAAKWKCMGKEAEFVHKTRELPLQSRLQAAAMFCNYSDQDWKSFEERRDSILLKRVTAWESARRFGHRLLPVVERQNGLCGDPTKDPNGKGCGCYLYAIPPTAVHLDHIRPRSKGGTNDLQNLQALCSACNISAGANVNDE